MKGKVESRTRHIKLKDQLKSYCGVELWGEWAFFDLAHVRSLPGVLVCPKCFELASQSENKPSVD